MMRKIVWLIAFTVFSSMLARLAFSRVTGPALQHAGRLVWSG